MPKPKKKRKVQRRTGTIQTKKPLSSRAIVVQRPELKRPWELNQEEVVLLKNYLRMGDASEVEVKACLEVARRYHLDPFKQGQIWFIKRWDSSAANAQGGKGANVWTPQTGIYGILHIAARDHKDFGSISEPEYGPMFQMDIEGHKFKAPEWCRIKVYKKGLAEPTVATIFFEEFCPQKWDNVRLFWYRMPRNQIAKCCKAQAVRFAYPDLSGLYIPEEMERIQEGEFTPSGRQIVPVDLQSGSRAAAQAVAARKLANGSGKPLEAEIVDPEPPKAQREPFKGVLILDLSQNEAEPVLRGDLSEILPNLQENLKTLVWKGDWWHIAPREQERLRGLCEALHYRLDEILPSKTSPSKVSPAPQGDKATEKRDGNSTGAVNQSAALTVVEGTIERVNSGMAGRAPVRQVTLILPGGKKFFGSCFHKSWWEPLDDGLGKYAVLVVKKNGEYYNIERATKIGSKEWDTDGIPVVQRKDQIAGQKTLY